MARERGNIDLWVLSEIVLATDIDVAYEAGEEPHEPRADRGEESQTKGLLNIYLIRVMVDWKESGLKLADDIKALNYSRANGSDELVTTSCTTAR